MGGRNAESVAILFAGDKTMKPLEYRLLSYMAAVARDDDPRYWRGEDDTCEALGLTPGHDLGGSQVRKTLRSLERRGLIERESRGKPGRNPTWLLTIPLARARQLGLVDNPDDDDTETGPLAATGT